MPTWTWKADTCNLELRLLKKQLSGKTPLDPIGVILQIAQFSTLKLELSFPWLPVHIFRLSKCLLQRVNRKDSVWKSTKVAKKRSDLETEDNNFKEQLSQQIKNYSRLIQQKFMFIFVYICLKPLPLLIYCFLNAQNLTWKHLFNPKLLCQLFKRDDALINL